MSRTKDRLIKVKNNIRSLTTKLLDVKKVFEHNKLPFCIDTVVYCMQCGSRTTPIEGKFVCFKCNIFIDLPKNISHGKLVESHRSLEARVKAFNISIDGCVQAYMRNEARMLKLEDQVKELTKRKRKKK